MSVESSESEKKVFNFDSLENLILSEDVNSPNYFNVHARQVAYDVRRGILSD